MVIGITFIFLLLLVDEFSCNSGIIEFKKIPDQQNYKLNSTVTLSCRILHVQAALTTMIRKGKDMLSDNCTVFNTEKYEMKCQVDNINGKKYISYQFTIKKLKWMDHGEWDCFYAHNKKLVTIEVKVLPVFKPLEIEPIKPMESKFENLGPEYSVLDPKGNIILKGRGSRTNPYNLRYGIALKMKCFSSCSFPQNEHVWSFANATHGPIDIKSNIITTPDVCKNKATNGMFSTGSEVLINCTILNMVGANEIVCKSTESNKTSLYVLCPGGERPWELTMGEIIGLAVSVCIIILLIFLLCLMVKRSKSAYHTPPDVSTNTYSSGVKV